ncbi:helix-turn-helix transcriptional regulator [Salinarimonas rosea]|uniref:helix-turn-helix transcriptional regulator n=1 Tax=Salinarimonas rosea TaxID=552063 RepID=UPI00041AA2BF|nr:hypothetical protein [Salinarimonas rosea]
MASPVPTPQAGPVYLTASQVRARYGGVADMTIWRWLRDPALGFPQPEYRRKRRYWLASDLDAFDAKQREASRPGPSGAVQAAPATMGA